MLTRDETNIKISRHENQTDDERSSRPNEKKKRGRPRTLTLKFLGSLNTVLSVSAWRAISTSISWTSPGSEDSMSERAAFNAALEAWNAGAGSELWTEEDITMSKRLSQEMRGLQMVGGRGGGSAKKIVKESGIIVSRVGK